MKNKMKKMYGRLSAIFMSAVLMMTSFSVTAAAQAVNLIDAFDPTFETGLPANNDLFGVTGGTVETTGGHDASTNSLALTAKGDTIWFRTPVEPSKNYNFSFWMRNSIEKSLQLGKCAFMVKGYKGSAYYEMANGGTGDWDWIRSGFNGYFGAFSGAYGVYSMNNDYAEYTFGITRDGAAADDWRQVTINFSTPPSGVTHVTLKLDCVVPDTKLAIDDLSVVETGNKPNRIFNGDFEAIRNDLTVQSASGIAYKNVGQTQIEEDDTGNHYLKVDFDGNNRINWGVYSKTATLLQGKDCGTRYKVSYKAKAKDKDGYSFIANKPASMQLDINKGGEFALGTLTDEWKTFTMYIDHTLPAKNGEAYFGQITALVWYAYPHFTLYVDDVSSWYDETKIGFYKSLDFKYQNADKDDRGFETTLTGLAGYDDIIMLESGVEAENINALNSDENGNRIMKVRAHYLPEATWGIDADNKTTVSFEKTEITLLAAVYKYEKADGEGQETKKLVDIKIANGTSSVRGETMDVVTDVTVPANTEGERYEVEAIALNMDGLKPIAEKTVLR